MKQKVSRKNKELRNSSEILEEIGKHDIYA